MNHRASASEQPVSEEEGHFTCPQSHTDKKQCMKAKLQFHKKKQLDSENNFIFQPAIPS